MSSNSTARSPQPLTTSRAAGGSLLAARRSSLLSMCALLFAAAFFSTGCGKKGDPLPPIQLIPAASKDLSVAQKGTELILLSGYPSVATNGMALPGLETVEVWALALPESAFAEGAPPVREAEIEGRGRLARSLRGQALNGATSGDRLLIRLAVPTLDTPADEEGAPTAGYGYALRFISSEQKSSSFSNIARLKPNPAPTAPTGLKVATQADGVEISWSGAGEAGSRIYRRDANRPGQGRPIATVEPEVTSYLDRRARYGERYVYSVTALTSTDPDVESIATEEREVDFRDRFAPPVPAGLLALGETDRIRLSWQASPAADLAGYNLYRSLDGSRFTALNSEPLTGTSFIDDEPGDQARRYRVSAVDTRGNESARSEAVSARLAN